MWLGIDCKCVCGLRACWVPDDEGGADSVISDAYNLHFFRTRYLLSFSPESSSVFAFQPLCTGLSSLRSYTSTCVRSLFIKGDSVNYHEGVRHGGGGWKNVRVCMHSRSLFHFIYIHLFMYFILRVFFFLLSSPFYSIPIMERR